MGRAGNDMERSNNKVIKFNKIMANNKEKKQNKKVRLSTIAYSLLIMAALFLGLAAALAYGIGVDNARFNNSKFARAALERVPFPAVIIDYRHFISIGELNGNLKAIKSFYENQDFSKAGIRVDFSTDDGKKRLKVREKQLLNKMVEDKVIEVLARRKGIRINDNLVSQNVSRKLKEYGGEEAVQKDLARLYGWDMKDFEKKVVKPSMYKEELKKIVFHENKNRWQESANKIKKAAEELKSGKEFSEVAAVYSEGTTAKKGGELGWFKKEQLIPKLAEITFSLKESETSGITESELGYHIIKLEEKKSEDGEEMARISQIFTRKFSFADWLEEQMKNMKFFVLMKDYYWDKENLIVEFKDRDMKKFEERILKEIQMDNKQLTTINK